MYSITLVAVAAVLGWPGVASADWHSGRIIQLSFGYDGLTVAFVISDWIRTNCTCYSAWANHMCLDRSRTSFKEEYAWILKARTVDQTINVNIDETTCKVIALYENN